MAVVVSKLSNTAIKRIAFPVPCTSVGIGYCLRMLLSLWTADERFPNKNCAPDIAPVRLVLTLFKIINKQAVAGQPCRVVLSAHLAPRALISGHMGMF